eukprot:TRINITY_DN5494_c0_g1_i1.p2 TRINITY_DN5494_c0_g1~~TRINITY_DN5494_c0_g1_i1.p2  ORF type:complete len:217 (+),score=-8.22 TRINITY_DN5494_c0_g1_i1:685-1335(+)
MKVKTFVAIALVSTTSKYRLQYICIINLLQKNIFQLKFKKRLDRFNIIILVVVYNINYIYLFIYQKASMYLKNICNLINAKYIIQISKIKKIVKFNSDSQLSQKYLILFIDIQNQNKYIRLYYIILNQFLKKQKQQPTAMQLPSSCQNNIINLNLIAQIRIYKIVVKIKNNQIIFHSKLPIYYNLRYQENIFYQFFVTTRKLRQNKLKQILNLNLG